MLKKLYVTYLVPFKTLTVKESEELQRFFDSISESDFQFIDVNKLLVDDVTATEAHATSMDKLVPMDYVEMGDDLLVVIDFRRFFEDSVEWSDDVEKIDIDKGITDPTTTEDKTVLELDKRLEDAITNLDQFDRVVSYVRAFDDTTLVVEAITKKDSEKTLSSSLQGVFDTLSISSQDYEYGEVFMNDLMTRIVQYDRKFTTDFVTWTDAIQTKNTGKVINDPQVMSDAIQRKNSTKLLVDNTNAITDKQYTASSLVKVDNTYPITDILNKVVSYIRSFADSVSASDTHKKASTKSFSDAYSLTDTSYKTSYKTATDYVFYQPDEDGLVTRDTYIDAQYYGTDYIESVNSYFKVTHDVVPVTDTAFVVPNYLKKDTFLYQPDEHGTIEKGTFADPVYFAPDYLATPVLYFKSLYELTPITDAAVIIANYGKRDSIAIGDIGGSLLNTTYMDSGYISGNYIGTLTSF